MKTWLMVFKGIKLCLREEEEEELGEEGVGEEELTAQTKTNRENLQTGEAAFSNMIFFFFCTIWICTTA